MRTREACTLEAALVLTLFDLLSLLQIITNSSRCTVQCSWSVNLGLLYFSLEKKDTAGGVVRHACNKHSSIFDHRQDEKENGSRSYTVRPKSGHSFYLIHTISGATPEL